MREKERKVESKRVIQEPHKEAVESLVSYGIGGGGALIATLVDISNAAQAAAIIVGCIIVCIRAVHDSVKLYRYIRDGE